jgi:hypothetical protein
MARASTWSTLSRSRSWRVPAAYRQPLLGKPDPRLVRCLAVSSALGAIVVIVILVTPARHVEMKMEEVPRRLAELILEPPAPPAPLEAEPRSESGDAESAPVAPPSAPAPESAPAEVGEAPSEPAAGVGQRRLEASRRVETGTAGREQAQRDVSTSLAQTQQEVKRTLAEVTSVLSAVKSTDAPASSAPRRGRPGGGRTQGDLAQIEAVKAAGPGSGGDGPVTAGLLDIGSITDVHSDLASADPSIAGNGGGVGGRRGGSGPGGRGSAGSGSRSGSDSGDAGVEGGAYRSNASLLATVRRYAPGIQYCYDNELKRDVSLSGKMVLVLTVLPSGAVSEVTIGQDTLGSPRLQECILAQVREWRFAEIEEGVVTFRTPFVFTPPES